ncbi:putative repressor of RNA polymerase III transcription Maf1 [Helianthus annuus]|nr:putative repressor of RNA polymerase III transcription Maf1 [Helianthus annuus]
MCCLVIHYIVNMLYISAVKAHQFFTEGTWEGFKQIFQSYMSDASKVWNETDEDGTLLETLYKTLDEVINLADCEVYSYDPNSDADPFIEKGALWSYNFFFYNRKLKRVVSFCFSCLSNLVSDGFPTDGFYYEEDGEIFDEMDM